MNNPLNNLKQEAQNIRLSQNEKATMRANIFQMIDASKRTQNARVRTQSSYSWFSVRFAVPLAAFLIIALGGSTAYAAQGALPGGILYPVKIYVNEGVQGALAISPEAKVSFHTSAAETRLKEAETLASEGKLDATTSAEIESNLNEHLAQADTIAATLEESDPAAGVEASVTLESSLAAHGSILARIGQGSSDDATKENSGVLALNVRSRNTSESFGGGASVAMKAATLAPQVQTMSLSVSDDTTSDASTSPQPSVRTMATMKISASAPLEQSTSTQKKIAVQLQKKASSEVSDAKDAFATAKRILSATTTAKVQAQFVDLAARTDTGNKQIQNGEYITARATFTAIIHDAVEISAFIEASQTFKKDFVRSAWNRNADADNESFDISKDMIDDYGSDHSNQNNSNQSGGGSSGSVGGTVQVSIPTPTTSPKKEDDTKSTTSVDATVDSHGVHVEVHL